MRKISAGIIFTQEGSMIPVLYFLWLELTEHKLELCGRCETLQFPTSVVFLDELLRVI